MTGMIGRCESASPAVVECNDEVAFGAGLEAVTVVELMVDGADEGVGISTKIYVARMNLFAGFLAFVRHSRAGGSL